jgi:beta-lactamase class A
MAQLLAHFVRSDTLSTVTRAHMIRILTQQQLNDRLSADWPEAIAFTHKTGSLPGIEHDAGILYPEAWKLTHDSHLP